MDGRHTHIPRCGVLASVVGGRQHSQDVPGRSQVLVVRPGTDLIEVSANCRNIAVYPDVAELNGLLSLRFVPLAGPLPEHGQWLSGGRYLVSNAVLRAETQRLTGEFTLRHALHDHLCATAGDSPVGTLIPPTSHRTLLVDQRDQGSPTRT